MKLYSLPHSPFAARVRLQIYLKNLPVEIADPPGFGTEAYAELNPTAKVPALHTDKFVLPESTVIMNYLEGQFPDPPLLPGNSEQRAIVQLMHRFADSHIQPVLLPLFSQVFNRTDSTEQLEEKMRELETTMGLQGRLMEHYQWGSQAEPDFADCALLPVVFYCEALGALFKRPLNLSEAPTVAQWWAAKKQNSHVDQLLVEMDDGLNALFSRLGVSQG